LKRARLVQALGFLAHTPGLIGVRKYQAAKAEKAAKRKSMKMENN